MRFDAGRMMAFADALPAPRVAGSVGERAALDALAGAFEGAGLRVERRRTSAFGTEPVWVVAGLYGANLVLYLWIVASPLPNVHRAWLTALFLPSLLLAGWWADRAARREGKTGPTHHLIGRPVGKPDAPLRVILLSTSTTPTSRLWTWMALPLALAAFGPVVMLITPWYERAGTRHPEIALALLTASWVFSLILVVYPHRTPRPPWRGDNRTGLTLLAELARTWPRGLAERAETWFVATPNPLALGVDLRDDMGDKRPTLVIRVHTPGVGPEIVIAGRPAAREPAASAARGLWLPHRTTARLFGWLFKTFHEAGFLCVGLRGRTDDRPIDPALLAATAQLVHEVTLRWVKQAGALALSKPAAIDTLD